MKKLIWIICISLFLSANVEAGHLSWADWVHSFRVEAIASGIRPDFFDKVFNGMQPDYSILAFDRRQPEKRITFAKYRSTRADSYKILMGQREFKRFSPILQKVGHSFGVDPCFIVALWGMESSYGRFMGHFPVIRSLATLSFDTRRSEFFKKELLLALRILQEGHVTQAKFVGEWAGGSGHPQFLPSSWHKFAVDFDKDGHKDIWTSHTDVFASIANYLVQNGWQTNAPWGCQVIIPAHFNRTLIGFEHVKTVREWELLGVHLVPSGIHPNSDLQASIVEPLGGPCFIVFNNFRVLLKYNNSTFYAATIAYMADRICSRSVLE